MAKMRYSESPVWAYRSNHPVAFMLTQQQVNAAVKQAPSFKMGARVSEYFGELRGKGQQYVSPIADSWAYVRRSDGSTWLVADTLWAKRCFEIPPAIAERLEELYNVVESW